MTELWAIVVENSVKAVGFVRSNVLKKKKLFKKEASPWETVTLERLVIESECDPLVNYVVDRALEGIER